jgi:riboflavin kinase
LKTITLKGKVFSGHGSGTKFLSLLWVRKQIREKFGFEPFLGTLNLKLSQESTEAKQKLAKTGKAIEIVPEKGFCMGLCFKARIMDKVDGAIVLPQVPSYPNDVLEVIAPVSLRETLKLREGDEVQLTAYLPQ